MKDKKVLVVDDEKSIREILRKSLEENCYTVLEAENSQEALDIVKNTLVKVVILDIHLPDINGADLCRQMRDDKPGTIFIAITGYSSVYDLIKCREAGFDDYFVKPPELGIILKVLDESFEKLDRWKS